MQPPGVLVIDNYDSFTFNLVQLVGEIVGEVPRVVRHDELTADEIVALAPRAVILSPGPGSPEVPGDVGVCRALVDRLPRTPLLGVCLGHQVLGLACGARVVRAPRPMHGRLSPIRHDGSGIFAGLPSPFEVVRYHSLVLERATLPPSLRVTAETDEGLIMAVAHADRPHLGVQFHPESILTAHGRALVERFLTLAGIERAARPSVAPRRASPRRERPRPHERHRHLPYVDPESAFMALYENAPSAFWLDGNGRFSYMGAGREVVRARSRRIEIVRAGATKEIEGDPFTTLERLLGEQVPAGPRVLPFELTSGYVGCLGYELKEFAWGQPWPRADGALPDLLLQRADRVLAFDREERRLTLVALVDPDEPDAVAERWFDETAALLASAREPAPCPASPGSVAAPFRVDRGERGYLEDIGRIRRLLLDGETYEICLTSQLRARRAGLDPLALHRVLRRENPAPWSAWLRFPECAVISASPERFAHVDERGRIESRPIKGTRPRGHTPQDDVRLRDELARSEKDRAENLMIVDLVRNDLGRVCEVGSVRVPRLMEVEAHPSVFQLVSTVTGQLAPGVSPVEAVRALFPGGSMTGAPKIRAMEIIGALERAPRGFYSGALGFFSLRGAVDLAMTIRTIVATEEELTLGVGGAIVALSDARAEYEEALEKARAPVRAVRIARGLPEGTERIEG